MRKPKPELPEFSPTQIKLISGMMGRGVEALLRFCIPFDPVNGSSNRNRTFDQKTLRIAMRRFVSVAWLLHSEMLVDDELDEQGTPTGRVVPLTLDQLGKLSQLDCTKVALSLQAKRFGERFKLHFRVQKRQGTKKNYANAAKGGWAKRRAREAAATTA